MNTPKHLIPILLSLTAAVVLSSAAQAEGEHIRRVIDESVVDDARVLAEKSGRVREFYFEDDLPPRERIQMSEAQMLKTAEHVVEHDYGYGGDGGGGEVEEFVLVICHQADCMAVEVPFFSCATLGMVSGQAYQLPSGGNSTCTDDYAIVSPT